MAHVVIRKYARIETPLIENVAHETPSPGCSGRPTDPTRLESPPVTMSHTQRRLDAPRPSRALERRATGAVWFRARKLSGSTSRYHEGKALPTLASSPSSCESHLTFATFPSTVLPVPRRNVPPPGHSPRRSPASRSAGLARRLWLQLAERRRWPSL